MSGVYRREAKPPWPMGKILKVVVSAIILIPLLGVGAIAALHLIGLDEARPLVRIVIVEGKSMEPTFEPGEQLLFVRKEWGKGSIVIADIGEPTEVIKRVWDVRGDEVIITGDNTQVTASYRLPKDKIIATFLCRTQLKFAPPQIGRRPGA